MNVASSWRHVDEQVIEFAPMHVIQKLFDGLRQHQAAPHECSSLVVNKHSRGNNFQQSVSDATLVWDDLWLLDAIDALRFKTIGKAKHARN